MKNDKGNALRVAVIGGGASGLAAAVFAARRARESGKSCKVTVYEGNPRVGKKILVTGSGRCNFTNECVAAERFRGDSAFAYDVYSCFDSKNTVEFFRSLGLYSKSDAAGRVYPLSLQATSVLDVLRAECDRLCVEAVTDFKVSSIKKSGKGFIINGTEYADKIILATGGKAAPVQGSDGSGFELIKPFGISVSPLLPALTPMVCADFPRSLKGIRAQGRVSIKCAGKLLAEDTGEIQYTETGLSGIPSMQVSRFAAEALLQGRDAVTAVVDSAPMFTSDELKRVLTDISRQHPDFTGEMLLGAIMPKKLGAFLISEASLNPAKPIGRLHEGVIDKIASVVKSKKYKISSVKGFSEAQVTAGGIVADEINPRTMELKKVKGLYVCGEIVNVDGECGGYNLQWAWSSAYLAGISVIQEN